MPAEPLPIGTATGPNPVAHVETVAFHGIDVRPIDVQVQITNGLPAFTVVGLPDKAVGESRERVRSALHALGLALPPKRITVSTAGIAKSWARVGMRSPSTARWWIGRRPC